MFGKRQVILRPDTKIVHLGGKPPRCVLVLLLAQALCFLLYVFTNGPAWVNELLYVSGATTMHRLRLWQPLSAIFLESSLQGLLLNLVVLWAAGSPLARFWGQRRFVLFYLLTAACGLAVGAGMGVLSPSVLLAGSGGATVAMLGAVAYIFTNHLIHLYQLTALKAKWAALIVLAAILLADLIGQSFLLLGVHLGGGLVGLLFLITPRHLWGRLRARQAKRKFQVIDGGSRGGKQPKYLN